jgi:arsenate reductase (thioredoxin)
VNPHALAELERRGIPTEGARSKSWDEYAGSDTTTFDLVITVCDSAANESCPVFFGDFVKAHWGLPDPASIKGEPAVMEEAFRQTEDVIVARLEALVSLPVETMSREVLQQELAAIDARFPAQPLAQGDA